MTNDNETTIEHQELDTRAARNRKNHSLLSFRDNINVFTLSALLVLVTALGGFGLYTKYKEVPNAQEVFNENVCSDFSDFTCTVKQVTHNSVSVNSKISQSLKAGSKKLEKTEIVLTYSLGPSSVKLPNYRNVDLEVAKKEIINSGLVVGNVTYESESSLASGRIISTSEEPDSIVENGTKIDFIVSDGGATVPDWNNKTLEIAQVEASELGLTLEIVEKESDKPSGIILSQSVKPGKSTSDPVVLTVSKKKEIVEIKIPDVIGMNSNDAQIALATEGFLHIKTVTVESNADEEKVTSIVPGVGQKAPNDENIVIVVEKPAK